MSSLRCLNFVVNVMCSYMLPQQFESLNKIVISKLKSALKMGGGGGGGGEGTSMALSVTAESPHVLEIECIS